MKLRHPLLISLVAFMAVLALRLWARTWRLRMQSRQPHPADPRRQRMIYVFWHESLLAPATLAKTNVQVLISRHADGELIARICRYLGHGVIRGSTSRGGAAALMELIRSQLVGHLAITPDGPRGPRRRLQPGVVQLASVTGLPVVPVGVGFSRAWRAGSWDRFALPKPFSTVTSVVAEPIWVPSQLDRKQLESCREQIEKALMQATEQAEQQAAGVHSLPDDQTRFEPDSLLKLNPLPTKLPHLHSPDLRSRTADESHGSDIHEAEPNRRRSA